MRVFINERDVGAIPSTDATIGEVIEAVRVHVDPHEILTAVEIDGVRYGAGDESRYARRSAASVATLVLTTEAPTVFAAAKRRDLGTSVDVIARKVEMVVELFRRPDERAANKLLAALMEELRLALLLDQQLGMLDHTSPGAARDEIQVFAPTLLAAQEQRQWWRLADLLEAQLVPVLVRWSASIAAGDAVAAR